MGCPNPETDKEDLQTAKCKVLKRDFTFYSKYGQRISNYPKFIDIKFPLFSMERTAWAWEPQPISTRTRVPGEKI